MPHSILLGKNRDLIKTGAEASVELPEIHEAFEAMPQSTQTEIDAKTNAATLIDTASDAVSDFNSDYQGRIDALKTAVGL